MIPDPAAEVPEACPDRSPAACVLAFCAAWTGPDIDAVLAHLAPDVIYHNIPMPPLYGMDQVESYLRRVGPFDACRWDVFHIAQAGEHVLTERVDRMVVKGREIVLPVMGIFRVRGGLICEWRDYFDLASYRAQFPQNGQ